MNQTVNKDNSGESGDLARQGSQPDLKVWVKPVLERLSLNDALTGPSSGHDGSMFS